MKSPAVYMMANKPHGTLYTGVTSDLIKRAYQHRTRATDGFAKRYGCSQLVWFEMHETMESAIVREKQLKGGSRAKKIGLIKALNPDWKDLYETLL